MPPCSAALWSEACYGKCGLCSCLPQGGAFVLTQNNAQEQNAREAIEERAKEREGG